MPMSPEVRRVGRGWKSLQNRVRRFMEGVGAEGVSLVDFERDCISGVDIPDRPGIIKALKTKKLIAPVRDGVAWRVYREVPENRRHDKARDVAKDQAMRALAPHMMRLALIVGDADLDEDERLYRVREAAEQVARIVRRHVGPGLSLIALREALAVTFNAEAVRALAHRERALDVDSAITEPAPLPDAPVYVPRNLPPHERIIAMVQIGGRQGVLKGEIKARFPKPRPKAEQIDEWLTEIEEAGMIYQCKVVKRRGLNPATRYYVEPFGPDHFDNGVGWYDL